MANETYTVTVTEAEDKALKYSIVDVQDWLDNFVHNQARKSKDEIYNMELDRISADPDIDSISTDKDQVVLAADIKTAQQRQEEIVI